MNEKDYENMIKKAKMLVGTWIYRVLSDEHCYVYDYEDWKEEQDVVLVCITVFGGDAVYKPHLKQETVHMWDFDEAYCKVPAAKVAKGPLKVWEEVKAFYDKMFKGE